MTDRFALQTSKASVHALWLGLLAVIAIALFVQSYERWGHPIIDLGRDLTVASEISEGRALYRERLYNYGPVAPYALAGAVSLLGDQLWVFESVGLVVMVICALTLYSIGASLRGPIAGATGTLLFLTLSAFADSTWGCNFVLPYAYAATIALAFALLSFQFLLIYVYGGRKNWALAISILGLWGALGSKIEIGAAIAGVHILAWWAHRLEIRKIGIILMSSGLLAWVFLSFFEGRESSDHSVLADNLLRFGPQIFSEAFFADVAGFDRPLENGLRAVAMAAGLVALLGASQLAAEFDSRRRDRQYGRAGLAATSALVGVGLVYAIARPTLFSATIVIAPIVFFWVLIRDRRDPLLLLAAFALLCGARIPLNYHPLWYGFTLCVPAYLLVVYGAARTVDVMPKRNAATIALMLLVVVGLFRFEVFNYQKYAAMTSRLETEKGTLYDFPIGRAEAVQEFLEDWQTMSDPPQTLVVFPEGATLNYFTGTKNPIAYQLFIPPEIPDRLIEEDIIRELQRSLPDAVVIVSRNLAEFGSRGFGIDYGRRLALWLRTHYRSVRRYPRTQSGGYRINLMRLGRERDPNAG